MGSTAVARGARSTGIARFLPGWRPRLWMIAPAALLALAVAEVTVRAIDARRGYSPHARTAWYWLFEQDPFLGYRGRPHASAWIEPAGLPLNADRVRHNADGFRDRRRFADLAPAPGRKLVLCVGDANTYGLTAGSEERTYPAMLEKELRALSGDPGWTVYNAGLPGYTSHEVLELVKLRLLRLQPDVIVHMGLQYEHEQVIIFLDERLDYTSYPLRMAPLASSPLTDALMRSALVGRLAQRWRERYVDDLGGRYPMRAYGEATPRGAKLYFDNLALLGALCRRSGVQLMLVDQPIHYSSCSYGPTLTESTERLRAGLRRLSAEAQAPLLEAHEGFDWDGVEVRGDMLLASNESVLGPEGYARLARRLAPQILKAYAAAPPAPAPAPPGD
jgi:lysophospholipase L1-like esterase